MEGDLSRLSGTKGVGSLFLERGRRPGIEPIACRADYESVPGCVWRAVVCAGDAPPSVKSLRLDIPPHVADELRSLPPDLKRPQSGSSRDRIRSSLWQGFPQGARRASEILGEAVPDRLSNRSESGSDPGDDYRTSAVYL